MSFDGKVPKKLRERQIWFGGIISQPLEDLTRLSSLTPEGNSIEEEARLYLRPSPTLRPEQRIELYSQQYWWRLLRCLQEVYPFLLRLYGYEDFNRRLAEPYLLKRPPCHWSLNYLGDRLSEWIREEYTGEDRLLAQDAAALDASFRKAIFSPSYPLPSFENLEWLNSATLRLQPHVSLFVFPYDLLSFRKEMLRQTPEYWLEADFPPLAKNARYACAIYRNSAGRVTGESIDFYAYCILSRFAEGETVDALCEWLENQEEELCSAASSQLHLWFQQWALQGLLRIEEN